MSVLCVHALRTAFNKEKNVKKKEKRTPPGERTAANRRKSVPSTETKPDTGEPGSRVGSLSPNEPGLLDRRQVETEAGTLISRPVASITTRGTPLKVRQQSGMTYIDGDESSYSRTFGTSDTDLGSRLFIRVVNSLPAGLPDNHNYILSALQGIGPKDAIEGLLAGNMVAVNDAAMHFLARATAQGQSSEAVDANVNWANKLFRTFTAQIEALNRYRGKIGHPVVVGNVSVNDGGQAIVGCVQHSGSERSSKDNEEKKIG
jgi:hypothetical protein